MTDVTNEVVLEAAEQAQDIIDGTVEVLEVVRTNPYLLAGAVVGGIIAGGVGGYFIAAKVLGKRFDERLEEEIQQAKDFYAGVHKVSAEGQPLSPEEVFAEAHSPEALAALHEYQGETGDAEDEILAQKAEARAVTPPVVASRNTFAGQTPSDAPYNFEEEFLLRTEDAPYIVTDSEYFTNTWEYDEFAWTYYVQDSTLADEDGNVITDLAGTVGVDSITRFGAGSNDRNIVYIVNETLGRRYEIQRSRGSYGHEVAGMDMDEPDASGR